MTSPTQPLLSVEEALAHILPSFKPLDVEQVALLNAYERVLAQDVIATETLPPFANSSMDGFAVRSQDVGNTPISLRVVMNIPAGIMPEGALNLGEAARIMTGAPLPHGADAVVPIEATDAPPGETLPDSVQVLKTVSAGAYVRPVGNDIQAGERVLRAGSFIGGAEMGVLAALGIPTIPVIRQPRVVILGSGDELVGVDEPLAPGKIRDSNRYALYGIIQAAGGIPIALPPARDTYEAVNTLFDEALALQPDVIVSSAGVSVGAYDHVRAVLEARGELTFWRVNVRPGKPLAFGNVEGVPFFGLPGNPVSAMVTFDLFVRPALLQLGGRPDTTNQIQAKVVQPITSDGRRSYLRVLLNRTDDSWEAALTGTQESNALFSMVKADGLLIVPEGVTHVEAGQTLTVRLLRDLDSIAQWR